MNDKTPTSVKYALALSNKRSVAGAKKGGTHLDRAIPLGGLLIRMANKIVHERVCTEKKKCRGGKPKFTDEQVKEIRHQHEKGGKTESQLASLYGLPKASMRAILRYVNYAKVV